MSYKLLDHTADLRVKFSGNIKKNLLKNSAIALSEIIFEIKQNDVCIDNSKKLNLKLEEAEFSELYIDFLREILFRINSSQFYFIDFNFKKITSTNLEAVCFYVEQDISNLKNEIKAVTYNELKITEDKEGWSAKVTFDI